ncbi:MAG: STAS domain-containing protein [Pyrinomonadaceae bacterium]|nr:STAS domain-containing protein [Pyrinomonadaceae bacterium]
MDNLIISERYKNDVTILDLTGNICLGESNVKFRSTLRLLDQEGKNNILLNLADVAYLDSSGLGELVAGYLSTKKNGGQIKLLNLNSRIREIMVMTKLLTMFDVFEDEEQAIDSFQNPSNRIAMRQPDLVPEKLDPALLNQ